MGSVDQRYLATNRRERAVATLLADGWKWDGKDWTRPPAAALREQPEARGVVDDATAERAAAAFAKHDHEQVEWERIPEEDRDYYRRVARDVITAAQQPVQEGGGVCPKCHDTGEVCTGYIDGTPEMFDCTCPAAAPPSAPVGVEADKIGFHTFSPGDRFYHAADDTWWRKRSDGRLTQADPPPALAQQPARQEAKP